LNFLFTAEALSTQRSRFFCFPLRGRKAKISNPSGFKFFNTNKKLSLVFGLYSKAESFSFAVLSTAKENNYFLCDLRVLSEAGGEFSLSLM
jgi:hypothetical protein